MTERLIVWIVLVVTVCCTSLYAELSTVRHVSITAQSADDVTVTWLPPTPPTTGSVTYELGCYPRHNPASIRYSTTTQTEFKLDYRLNTKLDYVVQVRVIGPNSARSAWTKPIVFRIFESDVPPAPRGVEAAWVEGNSVAVRWQVPDFPVSGYRLYYLDVGNDLSFINKKLRNNSLDGFKVVLIPSQKNEYQLYNLAAHMSYIVRLQAKNIADQYGPISRPVLAESDVLNKDAHLLIQNVTFVTQSNSIYFTWSVPEGIRSFVITYHGSKSYQDFNNRSETDVDSEASIRIRAQAGNYSLTNLKPYMTYQVSLQALARGKLGPAWEAEIRTNVGQPPIEGIPIVLQQKEDNSRVLVVSLPKVSDRNGPVKFCDLIVVQAVFYDLLSPEEIIYDGNINNTDPAVIVPMEYHFIPDKPYVTARFYKIPTQFELGNWEFVNKFLNKGLAIGNHYRLAVRCYTNKNVYSTTAYSPRFEIHEGHAMSTKEEGGSNDLAGTTLVLFVVADVMLFCMLSALGKLCHNHLQDICEKNKQRRPSMRGRPLRGFEKSVSLEMT